MSTDFDVVCDNCEIKVHAGQHMGGVPSFGWGSNSTSSQIAVAAWAFDHAHHGSVRIEISDSPRERPSDNYKSIELDDWLYDIEKKRWDPPKGGS